MKLSNTQLAVIALIIANTIWGAAPPIFKWSLQSIGIFSLGFFRFLIPVLILFFPLRNKLFIAKEDRLRVFLVGFAGITINILFFFLGLEKTTSISAAIIGSCGPIMIMFGSLFLLKEAVKAKEIVGNGIAFIGVMAIILEPILIRNHISHFGAFLGNIFLVIAAFGTVSSTLLARNILKKYDPLVITFWSFAIGSITFFPFFLIETSIFHPLVQINDKVVIGVLFGGLFSSLTAYFCYYWALKYLIAAEVGIFTYLDPIVTFVIAIPLLHEFPTPLFLLGTLLVFSGIYIAEGRIHWHPLRKLFSK